MMTNWLAYWMGYSRIANITADPPNHLYQEQPDGSFIRPMGATQTEVVLKFTFAGRLRLLASGKVHIVNVVWYDFPVTPRGDSFRWEVMPPWDKVDPKLKV